MAVLERAGRDFGHAADSIASHGRAVTAHWTGSASDAASDAIGVLATRAWVGADVAGGVGPVLRVYAAELRAAQAEHEHAAAAAGHWADAAQVAGEQQDAAATMPTGTLQLAADRDAAAAAAGAASAHATAQVASAQHTMVAAAARAERANQVAAGAVDALTEQLSGMGGPAPALAAPGGAARASSARDGAGAASGPWWQQTWDATTASVSHAAGQFGDFASSVTGYYAEHPDQLGKLLGSALLLDAGLLVTAAGAGVELGGIALDLTGIGALVGVPANIAGAAVMATGATLAAAGTAGTLDDLTTVLQDRDTTSSGAPSSGQLAISTRISPQKQARHILGEAGYNNGGYFEQPAEAQEVLDAYHSGAATVEGLTGKGDIIVEYRGVIGYNNNVTANYLSQPTHRFIIKGTKSVSVVPTVP